jgi:D-tyrosyl-tRNA(Tyr) deacylase
LQALAQRVSSATVFINNEAHSSINRGVLAFVCFEKHDTSEVIGSFISKITNFCFFKDDSNMMTANLKEIDAEIMIVSQFTLAAVTDKGNKPSFHRSAGADMAEPLYKELLEQLSGSNIRFKSGVFGAEMDIHSVNCGPVTFSFTI